MKRVFLLVLISSTSLAQTTVLWPYTQNQYTSNTFIPFGPQIDPSLQQQELARQAAAQREEFYRQEELALKQEEIEMERAQAQDLSDLYARLEEQDRKISDQAQEISDLKTEQIQNAYLNRPPEEPIKDPFEEQKEAEEAGADPQIEGQLEKENERFY